MRESKIAIAPWMWTRVMNLEEQQICLNFCCCGYFAALIAFASVWLHERKPSQKV